ncbi:DUF4258 domain-containing protein [Pararobbsia silviterrae]|nr:DUF4258 domain-containing protein [Pararobbsia silviterrae]
MSSDPIPFKLCDATMLRLVREAARDSGRVFVVAHAKRRMRERQITLTQVLDCLRRGSICEPACVNIHGHWQCTLARRHAGDDIRVATVLERRDDAGQWVIVVTVF